MKFFKKKRIIRRFTGVQSHDGYISTPYIEMTLPMDVQTNDKSTNHGSDGGESVQRLKVFCDYELYTDDSSRNQKGDQLWFQGKWFYCKSSRLSENTPLRHWTCTFIQCLKQDAPPVGGET